MRRHGGWVVLWLAAALPAGCSKRGEEQFIPAEATARQALEVALGAWKGGQARPGKLSLGKVGVEVVDPAWQAGQKLLNYQITSEEPGNGPRWFTVKLSLDKGERTVKYVVLG